MADWLKILIRDAILPEAMNYIREHITKTGTLPTDEEVFAHLAQHADAVITRGEAWLASKKSS